MALISLLLLSLALWQASLVKSGLLVALAVAPWLTRDRRKRWLLMGAVAFALLAIEGVLIAIDYRPFDDTQTQDKVPLPYVGFSYVSGFREPDPAPVILLGGSTVFNLNASSESATIAGRLEKLLDRDVANWGLPAYNSRQELITLLPHLDAPEIVITYDGINDLLLPYNYDPRPGYPYNFATTESGHRLVSGGYSLFDLYAVVMRKSRLTERLFKEEITAQLGRAEYRRTETWQRDIVAAYRLNLQTICDLSQARGFRYFAFLQPHLLTKGELTENEQRFAAELSQGYRDHASELYELATQMFAELQSSNPRCSFVDLSDLFASETGELYTDRWHANEQAYAIIASAIADHL